jgi:hypothetical protein
MKKSNLREELRKKYYVNKNILQHFLNEKVTHKKIQEYIDYSINKKIILDKKILNIRNNKYEGDYIDFVLEDGSCVNLPHNLYSILCEVVSDKEQLLTKSSSDFLRIILRNI